MTNKLARRLTLALGLAFAASAAQAQDAPPSSGVDYGAPVREGAAAPESRRERRERRADIAPYLEVAQGISTEFGGDTLTYTTLAAGVDGSVQTRRVTAVLSYRYDRLVEWNGNAGDTDTHSGIAAISAQVVPGAVNIEAGALATRTGGEGRALGVTERDQAVELYSVYAGPTVSTHVGPVAVNASYRLGYVAIDDDSVTGHCPGELRQRLVDERPGAETMHDTAAGHVRCARPDGTLGHHARRQHVDAHLRPRPAAPARPRLHVHDVGQTAVVACGSAAHIEIRRTQHIRVERAQAVTQERVRPDVVQLGEGLQQRDRGVLVFGRRGAVPLA